MGEVSHFLNRILYYPVVLIFLLNLFQRRHMEEGRGKRFAIFYIGLLFLAFWGCTFFFIRFRIPDGFLILLVAASMVLIIIKRRIFFPFRFKCAGCGQKLKIKEFLFVDSNLCNLCKKNDSTS